MFLSEMEYINQIRATIEGVKEEYQNDKSANASLLWEMIKLKVREQTLRCAKTKKGKNVARRRRTGEENKHIAEANNIDSECNNTNEKLVIN